MTLKVGAERRVEVVTAGKPLAACVSALADIRALARGAAVHVAIHHDDGCPTLFGKSLDACTCERVWFAVRRVR